ncbi:MAG: hypothetical protein IJI66_02615 [Erysipelotrichaceae bacterium]|nr:hypothetical protein [Erysipelotrichaceae bacterium]
MFIDENHYRIDDAQYYLVIPSQIDVCTGGTINYCVKDNFGINISCSSQNDNYLICADDSVPYTIVEGGNLSLTSAGSYDIEFELGGIPMLPGVYSDQLLFSAEQYVVDMTQFSFNRLTMTGTGLIYSCNGRNYTKSVNGFAIVGIFNNLNGWICPVVIALDPAVAIYTTSGNYASTIECGGRSIEYKGLT